MIYLRFILFFLIHFSDVEGEIHLNMLAYNPFIGSYGHHIILYVLLVYVFIIRASIPIYDAILLLF